MAKRTIIMEYCRAAQRDYERNRNAASPKIEQIEGWLRSVATAMLTDVDAAIASGNLHRTPNGALYIQLLPIQRRAQKVSASPAV